MLREDMKGFSFCLDWFRFTVPMKSESPTSDYFPPDGSEWKPAKSYGSYTEAVSNEFCTMLWNPMHPEFMVMFDFTGHNLSDWRIAGHSDDELVKWAFDENAKATRVDFAIDFLNVGARAEDFTDCWHTDRLKTSARSRAVIDERDLRNATGYTVYIGARTSDRLVRVYHKGLQTKTGYDWVRVELEWKGKRAQQMHKDMIENGVVVAGKSHLRNYIHYTEIKWFEESFRDGENLVDIDAIGRRETDTERWLREVCIPAVATAVKNGVPGVLEALEAIITEHENGDRHGPRLTPSIKP